MTKAEQFRERCMNWHKNRPLPPQLEHYPDGSDGSVIWQVDPQDQKTPLHVIQGGYEPGFQLNLHQIREVVLFLTEHFLETSNEE